MNAVMSIPQWLQRSSNDAQNTLPTWLAHYKQQHWQAFLANGLPTKQNEAWKYTDLSFLANQEFTFASSMKVDVEAVIKKYRLSEQSILLVMINGCLSEQYSELHKLPKQVLACCLQQAIAEQRPLVQAHWPQELATKRHPFAMLNAALFNDGLFLYVPENCAISLPIQMLSIATAENNFIAYPRRLIILEKNAQVTLLDQYVATSQQVYFMNTVTHFSLAEQALLAYTKLQLESSKAIHMANAFVCQQKNSQATFTNFSVGGIFSRDDLTILLQAPGAKCKTAGLYCLTENNQYMDHHVEIDHQAPRSQSEMLYKGILDKKSRAVFNGCLHVAKDSQKILAYQANHNLLLSNMAEIYSKPELEIYADDVKCKHGATTGQLDEEALFYLRSRGIEQVQAKKMLLQGFADEIFDRIAQVEIKHKVETEVRGRI